MKMKQWEMMKRGRGAANCLTLTIGSRGGASVTRGRGRGAVHHNLPLGTFAGTPVDGARLVQVYSAGEEEKVVTVVQVWRKKGRGEGMILVKG